MNFPDESISNYAEAFSAKETDVLAELNRETQAKVLLPQMLSGRLQGRILAMFSKMIKPTRILEIGTFTGYSAICLSEGLASAGHLHTIDNNEELTGMIKKYIQKAGIAEKVSLHIGNAKEIIPTLNEVFDLVFIDADKINYSNYYDLVFDKVRPGGFIIADNVLWSGKVLASESEMDKDTRALFEYSKKITADARVETVLLPVRDGLLVAWKKS